jgi:uncharacterized protein
MTDLSKYGPWALVAGASVGLGAAFADEAARNGFNLVTIARRAELLDTEAERLRSTYGIEVRAIVTDLMSPDLAEVVDAATDDIEIGLLIYNATIAPTGPFLEVPLAEHLDGIKVNCNGATVLAHLLGQKMVARGHGGMAFVTSMGALQGGSVFASYFAAKAYEWILAEGLWSELRPKGVDVIAYVVGATLTPNYTDNGGSAGTVDLSQVEVADHFQTTLNRVLNPADPAVVVKNLFTTLPHGPVTFSVDIDERSAARVLAMSRRDAVETMTRLTTINWGEDRS